MTASKTSNRSIVILKLPTRVSALITYAQGIVKAMTGNASFPTTLPPLVTVTAAITDLQAAETVALTRMKGAVVTRNEKRMALVMLLEQLRSQIQATADANVENGASIIMSAGLDVRKAVVRSPRVFGAKPGPVTGTAKVFAASAGQRASYEWEYSADGGKTWVTAPVTLQAKTTVAGLVAGTTVQFRYRPVTKAGEGNWTQPVSLLVP
jgi:hypothetical protein